MRRTLIIAAAVIVLVGLGVVAYVYFFGPKASVAVAPGGASLPGAGQGVPASGSTSTATTTAVAGPTPVTARLVEVSAGPVVPGVVVTPAASSTAPGIATTTPGADVSFVDRQSGNIFSYFTAGGQLIRTSNKTIPGIESASWLTNGSAALVRYLSGADFSTINTYELPANGAGGGFLAQNIAGIAVSGTSVLSLASGVNGSVASVSHADGSHAVQVFTTPLSALTASFAGKNQYLAFTKPSATLDGYAFLVDSAGRFSRIAGPLPGLVALASPSGAWVLVSYATSGTLQMELINTTTRAAIPLPVATIADKCAWTADSAALYCGIPMNPPTTGLYPDDWYQGALSFSDRIWKIDVAGRYAQFVLDFEGQTGKALDAEALALDPAGTTLAFVNKIDGSLWAYSL